MRDDMLRSLDRIVEDHLTTAVREGADQRATEGAGPGADASAVTAPLWQALEEAGFTGIGAGGEDDVAFVDAMALVRRAAYHALPVPLGETVAARRLLARFGIAAPEGAITLASPVAGSLPAARDGGLSGTARDVAYGRLAPHAVVATPDAIALVAIEGAVAGRGTNMAGEPRDTLDLGRARLVSRVALADAPAVLEADGALLRAVQLSGALTGTLDHALTWVNDRVQFGRPIGKHQAVQHLMAQLAEETAAAGAAADLALAASTETPDRMAVAIAKARAGEAAGRGANIAHAVFGAMGFTREHPLHYTTRRLWAWRNEFGSEVYWQGEIGRAVAARGGSGLWGFLTRDQ